MYATKRNRTKIGFPKKTVEKRGKKQKGLRTTSKAPRHGKGKAHGKPAKTTLRNKADKLFSKFIRLRGYCQLQGKDTIRCGGALQCMHIQGRGAYSVRWNQQNALCGCQGHHVYYTYHPNKFRELMLRWYPKEWEKTEALSHITADMTVEKYEGIIKYYSEKLGLSEADNSK